MVSHGSAKKRRRGTKVKQNGQKNIYLRMSASVASNLKKVYDVDKSPEENLANMGLMADANAQGKATAANANSAFVGYLTNYQNAPNKERKTKLSDLDKLYIKKCIDKHGEDYKAMERDMKLNYMQHTAKQMEKMIKKYHATLQDSNEDEEQEQD
ncbi:hypothetical protein EON65_30145 [archaeon]|nr:MAG: hypothetical protein EON65_30145 [archaeon]